MAKPYSLDLRERVVKAVKGGMDREQAALIFGISRSTVNRWLKREAETGSPAALPMGGHKPFSLASEATWVRTRLAEQPDIGIKTLLAELQARGVRVSYYGVWHFVDRAGLTDKKNPFCG